MTSNNIVIYTSLTPKLSRSFCGSEVGDSYQRACISSWRTLSENIVSLNSRPEIEKLADRSYGIEFYETETAPPLIGDFIKAAKKSGRPIAAIVNADCMLAATPGTLDAAVEAASSGIVLFERLNVSAELACPTGQSCHGFDLFIFNTVQLAGISIDDSLRIGNPWWDFWFPIAFHRAGGELISLNGPPLIHLEHPTRWSEKAWFEIGTRLLSYLAHDEETFLPMAKPVSSRPTKGELSALTKRCYRALQSKTKKLAVEDDLSNFHLLFLRGIEDMGNSKVFGRANKAESQPLKNLNRYLKWQSSSLFAVFAKPFSNKFALKMQRRSIKNAPLAVKDKATWKPRPR
ncbi:MAG: hypothetical protein ACLP7P_07495 [Rhodomicrobium sp.]